MKKLSLIIILLIILSSFSVFGEEKVMVAPSPSAGSFEGATTTSNGESYTNDYQDHLVSLSAEDVVEEDVDPALLTGTYRETIVDKFGDGQTTNQESLSEALDMDGWSESEKTEMVNGWLGSIRGANGQLVDGITDENLGDLYEQVEDDDTLKLDDEMMASFRAGFNGMKINSDSGKEALAALICGQSSGGNVAPVDQAGSFNVDCGSGITSADYVRYNSDSPEEPGTLQVDGLEIDMSQEALSGATIDSNGRITNLQATGDDDLPLRVEYTNLITGDSDDPGFSPLTQTFDITITEDDASIEFDTYGDAENIMLTGDHFTVPVKPGSDVVLQSTKDGSFVFGGDFVDVVYKYGGDVFGSRDSAIVLADGGTIVPRGTRQSEGLDNGDMHYWATTYYISNDDDDDVIDGTVKITEGMTVDTQFSDVQTVGRKPMDVVITVGDEGTATSLGAEDIYGGSLQYGSDGLNADGAPNVMNTFKSRDGMQIVLDEQASQISSVNSIQHTGNSGFTVNNAEDQDFLLTRDVSSEDPNNPSTSLSIRGNELEGIVPIVADVMGTSNDVYVMSSSDTEGEVILAVDDNRPLVYDTETGELTDRRTIMKWDGDEEISKRTTLGFQHDTENNQVVLMDNDENDESYFQYYANIPTEDILDLDTSRGSHNPIFWSGNSRKDRESAWRAYELQEQASGPTEVSIADMTYDQAKDAMRDVAEDAEDEIELRQDLADETVTALNAIEPTEKADRPEFYEEVVDDMVLPYPDSSSVLDPDELTFDEWMALNDNANNIRDLAGELDMDSDTRRAAVNYEKYTENMAEAAFITESIPGTSRAVNKELDDALQDAAKYAPPQPEPIADNFALPDTSDTSITSSVPAVVVEDITTQTLIAALDRSGTSYSRLSPTITGDFTGDFAGGGISGFTGPGGYSGDDYSLVGSFEDGQLQSGQVIYDKSNTNFVSSFVGNLYSEDGIDPEPYTGYTYSNNVPIGAYSMGEPVDLGSSITNAPSGDQTELMGTLGYSQVGMGYTINYDNVDPSTWEDISQHYESNGNLNDAASAMDTASRATSVDGTITQTSHQNQAGDLYMQQAQNNYNNVDYDEALSALNDAKRMYTKSGNTAGLSDVQQLEDEIEEAQNQGTLLMIR